jgi:hypothetical protein
VLQNEIVSGTRERAGHQRLHQIPFLADTAIGIADMGARSYRCFLGSYDFVFIVLLILELPHAEGQTI